MVQKEEEIQWCEKKKANKESKIQNDCIHEFAKECVT